MKRVLFLLFVLLIATLFISCSRDEDIQTTPVQTVFVMNSTLELDFVAIRINDNEGHTIHNYEYQNIKDLNLNITDGSEIMVYVVEPGYFDYQYTMYNSNSSVQFEGVQYGNTNHTLIKQYQLQ